MKAHLHSKNFSPKGCTYITTLIIGSQIHIRSRTVLLHQSFYRIGDTAFGALLVLRVAPEVVPNSGVAQVAEASAGSIPEVAVGNLVGDNLAVAGTAVVGTAVVGDNLAVAGIAVAGDNPDN